MDVPAGKGPATARLEIDFVVGAVPVAGTIRDSGGSESPFTGWLELLGALERLGGPKTASESDLPPGTGEI